MKYFGSILCFVFVLNHSRHVDAEDYFGDLDTTKASIRGSEDLDCGKFEEYVINCTVGAVKIYNSTHFAPPLPSRMGDWCRSIKHLSQCGMRWNDHCAEISDNHFNTESMKGHAFVATNVCDNEAYLERYKWETKCIPNIANDYEYCYTTFKDLVDELKNGSNAWTHYDTHFQMCCLRAQFRRCTYDILKAGCSETEAIVLQKFTVVISEGEVYQNCERGVVYEKCPGGDPRFNLRRSNDEYSLAELPDSGADLMSPATVLLMILFMFTLN